MGVIQLAKKTTVRDVIKECIKGGKGLTEFAEVKTQIVETIIKINEVNIKLIFKLLQLLMEETTCLTLVKGKIKAAEDQILSVPVAETL